MFISTDVNIKCLKLAVKHLLDLQCIYFFIQIIEANLFVYNDIIL